MMNCLLCGVKDTTVWLANDGYVVCSECVEGGVEKLCKACLVFLKCQLWSTSVEHGSTEKLSECLYLKLRFWK